LGLLGTHSGEKHTTEPAQSRKYAAMLKSFSQCFRLAYCLESFRGTIR